MPASEIAPSLYCSYISVLQSADGGIISKELGTGNRLRSPFYVGTGKLKKGCVDDITIEEYHWQLVKRSWFSLNPSVGFNPANFSVPAGNARDGIRITLTPENDVILGGARYLYIQQLTTG